MTGSILVVEDDPTLARSIARNLEARGYVTVTTTTVAGARAAIAHERPTLAVLDVDLPDGSGWEVLRELRTSGGTHVAAIVMSAMRPNQRLADELGCVGVLEKPFPMESLLRLVARGCGEPAEPVPDEQDLDD